MPTIDRPKSGQFAKHHETGETLLTDLSEKAVRSADDYGVLDHASAFRLRTGESSPPLMRRFDRVGRVRQSCMTDEDASSRTT